MKICWLLILSVTIASQSPLSAWAQVIPTYILPKSEINRQYPKVKRGDNGTLALTYVELVGNTTTVYVSVSTDNGSRWSVPASPGKVKYASIGLQRQPYVIVDNTDVLHCLWENNIDGGSLLLYYSRSTDLGKTWSTPSTVYIPAQGSQDFSSIASDRSGSIYITYLAYEDTFSDGSKHVFIIRSSDKGITWGLPVRVDRFVAGGVCECCIQNVVTSNTGEVAVAFRSNIANRRDVFVTRSTDFGVTFEQPVLVQDEVWMINACPSTGPSLTYDGSGDLHIAWRDSRNSVGLDVAYYARVRRGSRETPTNISLSGQFSQGAEYPVPAVFEGNSNEVVVFFESTLGVAYGVSMDGGATFSIEKLDPLVIHSAGISGVFTEEHRPVAFWQADRDDKLDVAMGKLSEFVPVSVQERNTRSDVSVRYRDGSIFVNSTLNKISNLKIYSINGELIYSATASGAAFTDSFHLRGVGFCTVILQSGERVQQLVIGN